MAQLDTRQQRQPQQPQQQQQPRKPVQQNAVSQIASMPMRPQQQQQNDQPNEQLEAETRVGEADQLEEIVTPETMIESAEENNQAQIESEQVEPTAEEAQIEAQAIAQNAVTHAGGNRPPQHQQNRPKRGRPPMNRDHGQHTQHRPHTPIQPPPAQEMTSISKKLENDLAVIAYQLSNHLGKKTADFVGQRLRRPTFVMCPVEASIYQGDITPTLRMLMGNMITGGSIDWHIPVMQIPGMLYMLMEAMASAGYEVVCHTRGGGNAGDRPQIEFSKKESPDFLRDNSSPETTQQLGKRTSETDEDETNAGKPNGDEQE